MWRSQGVGVCFLLLLMPSRGVPGNSWRSGDDLSKLYDAITPNPTGSLSGPYFDQDSQLHRVGVRGKTTHLACRVKNLSNYTVSWVRHRDTHLLTIGGYTFSKDSRFSSVHKPSSENWVLEITNTHLNDAGVYECQISTTPVRSLQFQLTIADAFTKIIGSRERHIDFGSLLNLTCAVANYPLELPYILWYHNHKLIQSEESSFTMKRFNTVGGNWSSSLQVLSARQLHSGTYNCVSPTGQSQLITVHVHKGNGPEELQLNNSPAYQSSQAIIIIMANILLFLSKGEFNNTL